MIFFNLKNLFSHCFSTFFPFHNLQLCSYNGKYRYIYVIGIKKFPPFIQTPTLIIFTEFTPVYKDPPFIWDLRIPTVRYSFPQKPRIEYGEPQKTSQTSEPFANKLIWFINKPSQSITQKNTGYNIMHHMYWTF